MNQDSTLDDWPAGWYGFAVVFNNKLVWMGPDIEDMPPEIYIETLLKSTDKLRVRVYYREIVSATYGITVKGEQAFWEDPTRWQSKKQDIGPFDIEIAKKHLKQVQDTHRKSK